MKKIISTSFVVASCLCLLLILPATAVHPPRTLSFEEIVSGQIEDDGGEMQDINLDASVNLCYNVKAFQLYEGDTRHFPGETWIYDKHDRYESGDINNDGEENEPMSVKYYSNHPFGGCLDVSIENIVDNGDGTFTATLSDGG